MEEELKAIEDIGKHVNEIKSDMGKKADKSEFKAIEDSLAELKSGLATYDDAKMIDKIKEVNEALESLTTKHDEIVEELRSVKDRGAAAKKRNLLVTKAEISEFVTKMNANVDKSRWEKMNMNSNVIFKAAEDMGEPEFFDGDDAGTDTTVFTGRAIDPRLYERKRKSNLILNHMNIGTVGAPKLFYMEKVEEGATVESDNDPGGAAWILSGEEKPKRSFRVKSSSVDAKKVAIFGTLDDKLIRDVPSVQNWLRTDFVDELMEAYNDAILNNDPVGGDTKAPLGMKENAILYGGSTAFDGSIPYANEIDAILATAAYLSESPQNEMAQKAFVSSSIYYKIMNIKDQDGRYMNNGLVYVNQLGELFIGGIKVVGVNSEDVPNTHLLVTCEDLGFQIRNYGSLVFEAGLNGENFREDKTSYRAYQEVLTYIPEHRHNSVLYDTFDNIITDIDLGS